MTACVPVAWRVRATAAMMLLATAGVSPACNVPVFRYALERWHTDHYALVLAHDAPLAADEQKAADFLRGQSWEGDGKANLSFQSVNMTTDTDAPAREYIPADVPRPAMFLFYPATFGQPTLIWQASLSDASARQIARSPTRDKIVEELVQGRTAVWILLESGDRAEDERAHAVLRETLDAAEAKIKLPAGVVTASGEVTGGDAPPDAAGDGSLNLENQLVSGIPLKISFAVVRLSRDLAGEDVLRAMLLHLTPELAATRGQAMAFPAFGRARVLRPLVGDAISRTNIMGVCEYLCGPCACQIKAEHPGVDLLIEEDWDARLAGASAVPERALPPLRGMADLAAATSASAAAAGAPAASPTPKAGTRLGRTLVWAGAAVVALLVILSASLLRKGD